MNWIFDVDVIKVQVCYKVDGTVKSYELILTIDPNVACCGGISRNIRHELALFLLS